MRWIVRLISPLLLIVSTANAFDLPPMLSDAADTGGFPLVYQGKAPTIFVEAGDATVVRKSADLLADDIARVTGIKPQVIHDPAQLAGMVVLIGSLGHSPTVDRLVAEQKLNVGELAKAWETFQMQVVEKPLPKVDRAVIIIGSDRRGAAYGVLELSEQIGVSPWNWWADVPPTHRTQLILKNDVVRSKPPTVKYRGIFINDEDWGLRPWAGGTLDPQRGNVGPKAYERVFELLLRLKANYLWPAMHQCSTEFGSIDENVQLADDWGIVMGASHCEPMNRNNIWWSVKDRGEWRFDLNRESLIQYWREWGQQRGKFEAVWTVGLRGIHDSGLKFPADLPGQAKLVGEAIDAQRKLLGEFVNAEVASVPQAFMPYKEALNQYQAGMQLPDDVTLVWCDDNFGYIRQLSNDPERQRRGGSGVYYHQSYLGRPRPYLWLETTPPALLWTEMSKALAFGADRIWVLNVGDIKPGEIGMEFFLRMAYDASRFGTDAQPTYLKQWAGRTFGEKNAEPIARVLQTYYELASQRKPELLENGIFNQVAFDEARVRSNRSKNMADAAEAIATRLAPEQRDAYYELVLYPVRIFSALNTLYAAGDEHSIAIRQGRVLALPKLEAEMATATETLNRETDYFNTSLAGGKWNRMMTLRGTDRRMPPLPTPTPAVPTTEPSLQVLLPNQVAPVGTSAMPFDGIEIVAATASVEAPWQIDQSRSKLLLPTAKNFAKADGAPKATVEFDVPTDRKVNLFALTEAVTDRPSLWFCLDDQPWQMWEDPHEGVGFNWTDPIAELSLTAGRHKLTFAQRNVGIAIAKLRLAEGPAARTLTEEFPVAERDTVHLSKQTPSVRLIAYSSDGQPPRATVVSASGAAVEPMTDSTSNEHQQEITLRRDNPSLPQLPASCTVTVQAGAQKRVVHVVLDADVPASQPPDGVFVEQAGYVSIIAKNTSRSQAAGNLKWTVVDDLGRTGGAITAMPASAPSRDDVAAIVKDPVVAEYDFVSTHTGQFKAQVYCLPTHRISIGHGVRYAISIDDAPPTIVDFAEEGGAAGELSPKWNSNVARNVSISETALNLTSAGKHTLKLWMVDPGIVVDKLVLDFGGVRPSELGPPQSPRKTRP